MPIAVECPQCEAALSAPDTAAGKKIRCPECQAVVPVPREDDEAPRPKRRKKKASVPDREEDNRPRRRRKKAEASEDDEDRRDARDEDDDEEEGSGGGGPPGKIPPPVWVAYSICIVAIFVGLVSAVLVVMDASARKAEAVRSKNKPPVANTSNMDSAPAEGDAP